MLVYERRLGFLVRVTFAIRIAAMLLLRRKMYGGWAKRFAKARYLVIRDEKITRFGNSAIDPGLE